MTYRSEIDGLRALAVIPVILFHAGFEIFSGGFIGVDIFFVISGYLISSLIIDDLEKKKFSLIHFYERRARRILPALFLVTILCIPFAWKLMLPSQMTDFSQSLVSISTFSSNFLFWLKSGYFAADAHNIPLLHTWSLAVEEQFYFFFPIILLVFWSIKRIKIFWVIIVLSLISILISEWGWRNAPSMNFYLAPGRIWELFAGALCALYLKDNAVKGNNSLAFLGMFIVLACIFLFNSKIPMPSLYGLLPVIGIVLIIVFANKETFLAHILSSKYFVGLGLISYSAYLWHHPLFAFTRLNSLEEPSYVVMISLSILSLFLAALSWKFIETPFRNKNIISSRLFLLIILPITFFIACFGIIGHKTNGYGQYLLNESQFKIVKSLERSTEPNCELEINECLETATKNSVLLLGDSNAYHFSRGLKELTLSKNKNYIQITFGGCLPLSKFNRIEESKGFNRECNDLNQRINNFFKSREFKIDTIVISAAWLLYYHGSDFYLSETNKLGISPLNDVILSLDGKNQLKGGELNKEFYDYLEKMVDLLSKKTKNLIVVGPMPPALIDFENRKNIYNPISSKKNTFDEYSNFINQSFRKLLKIYNFEYVDLTNQLCDDISCKITKDKEFLYGNSTHFSDFGQNKIIKPLLNNYMKK